jgi:hypothetical protein
MSNKIGARTFCSSINHKHFGRFKGLSRVPKPQRDSVAAFLTLTDGKEIYLVTIHNW